MYRNMMFGVAVKLKILQIIMWNIGMAKETRSGCLVHIVQ